MLSVSYAGKNAYSAGKTSGVLRGGASGANKCYVLAHCGGRGGAKPYTHTHRSTSWTGFASSKKLYLEPQAKNLKI